MEERTRFVLEYERGWWTMTDLCAIFGIARETGYYWLRRYQQGGLEALRDQSRMPERHPNQTPAKIERAVLELRREHMRWGPRKLKRVLEREAPERPWPAASTIGAMLAREGLVVARKKRRRAPPYTAPFAAAEEANRVWCADFKGWFQTQDGERVDPLTISDAYSRYLLRCQSVKTTRSEQVGGVFEAAFRECGLPQAIRTDNGVPFASRAIAGLSRLAVWWMKLGIVPERIAAGHPEQNGRHERMHRTLKQETASPPAANWRAQQRAFDRFRREYNEERPHEALDMQTPAAVYTPSQRAYPPRVAGAGVWQRFSGAPRRVARRVFLETPTCVCERNTHWRMDRLPAGGRAGLHGVPCGVSDRAVRQSSPGDPAPAETRRRSCSWCRGRGSIPFPGTPTPRRPGIKSVRHVPGLKCQACPRPYRVSRLWRCRGKLRETGIVNGGQAGLGLGMGPNSKEKNSWLPYQPGIASETLSPNGALKL